MPLDNTNEAAVVESPLARRKELIRVLRAGEFDFEWNFSDPCRCALKVARDLWGRANISHTNPEFLGLTFDQFIQTFYGPYHHGLLDTSAEDVAERLEKWGEP